MTVNKMSARDLTKKWLIFARNIEINSKTIQKLNKNYLKASILKRDSSVVDEVENLTMSYLRTSLSN